MNHTWNPILEHPQIRLFDGKWLIFAQTTALSAIRKKSAKCLSTIQLQFINRFTFSFLINLQIYKLFE